MNRIRIQWLHLRRFNCVSEHFHFFAWFDANAKLVSTFALGVN